MKNMFFCLLVLKGIDFTTGHIFTFSRGLKQIEGWGGYGTRKFSWPVAEGGEGFSD